MKKIFIACGSLIAVVVLCLVCVVSMYLLFPTLDTFSGVLGLDKPRDLGITYSEADLTRNVNLSYILDPSVTPDANTSIVTFTGTKQVDFERTNSENTAHLNNWYAKYNFFPLYNAQMRVNEDGTVEVAGMVNINKLNNLVLKLGYSQSEIDIAKNYVKIPDKDFAIYIKGTASVINNEANINLTEINIGIIPIPASVFSNQKNVINEIANNSFAMIPNLYLQKVEFANSTTFIQGTFPETAEIK